MIRWHGLMPGEEGLGETGDDLGIFRGEVGDFGAVIGEVVELGLGAIVVAEELPIAFAHGEIGLGLADVGKPIFPVGWTTPVDGLRA